MSQWLKIYSTPNLPRATIVKGMLEENNIPVMMVNKQDSSYLNFGDIEVYVPAHFTNIARDLMGKSLLN